jgi:hypothetical protein
MTQPAPVTMTRSEAVTLTETIATLAGSIADDLEDLAALVNHARDGRADIALGYQSWPAYVAAVVGAVHTQDREQRRTIVGYLSEQGLSTRAIAPIVGVDQATVIRDRAAIGDANASPDPEPTAPQPITGLDGKTYPRPRPVPDLPAQETAQQREQRLNTEAIDRARSRLEKFIQGWTEFRSLRTEPNRAAIIAALTEPDQQALHTIARELSWTI